MVAGLSPLGAPLLQWIGLVEPGFSACLLMQICASDTTVKKVLVWKMSLASGNAALLREQPSLCAGVVG